MKQKSVKILTDSSGTHNGLLFEIEFNASSYTDMKEVLKDYLDKATSYKEKEVLSGLLKELSIYK